MQTIQDNAGETPITLLRKLLLVDDEADGADCAAVLLRSHGMAVNVVHSAKDALHALETQTDIDVVLTDIMMPGMTGLELADAIRTMYPAIKVVLMSGYVLPEALKDRQRDYLLVEKPYKMATLLKALHS